MTRTNYRKTDWLLIGLYLLLVLFGWLNIYSSSAEEGLGIFDLGTKYGMHIIWMSSAFLIATLIMTAIPSRLYQAISLPLYLAVALLLIAVAVVGVEVNGSKSWFAFGPFRFQPAEFSKISTSLLAASFLSRYNFSFSNKRDAFLAYGILLMPILFILMEKETGSALVYLGFLLAFYREGMTGWILSLGLISILLFILTLVLSPFIAILVLMGILTLLGAIFSHKLTIGTFLGVAVIILTSFLPKLLESESVASLDIQFSTEQLVAMISAPFAIFFLVRSFIRRKALQRNLLLGWICGLALIFSVQFVFDHILQDHQRARIEVLFGIKDDPKGVGYNVHQSLIAIGSGGLTGKGFHQGTQTRFNFVPEQSTDFIFCTIGEEWGFLGSLAILGIYLTLILRILSSAEKQKDKFTQIYGYCIASCILMHVFINIGMTIGLMPVIGIPLPFISYGGSSLWAFTIMLFIYLRLDLERWNKY